MISWFEKQNLASWIVTVLIGIIIYYVSSLEFGGGYGGSNLQAMIYHLGAFFFFGLFLMISSVRGKRKIFFIFAILLSAIFAILDELHQYFVPGRYCSMGDVFLDSVGVVFAFLIYSILIESR
ncbi:VanZ family protein [Candidatus Pacearchaeota archaeon]|nr:VanZ family protein [Candidatus Pacearchaeota archaeon]